MSVTSTLSSRKMSGLGIDFSSFDRSPSEAGHLWEDTGIYAIHSAAASLHPSPIQPQRKMSRWSESTRASHPVTLSGASEMGHSMITSASSSARKSPGLSVGPSRLGASQAERNNTSSSGAQLGRGARGSDDSQASSGPSTPTDDIATSTFHSSMPNSEYLAMPRRAPLPPSQTRSPVLPSQRPHERRPSISQSMMRTLTGRKKDMAIPPPLELVPAIPALPANLDLAPIIHHVTLPVKLRKDSKGSSSRLPGSPSPTKSASFRPSSDHSSRRESASKTPRASFSSVIRSIRKSISSDSRKSSSASAGAIPAHLIMPVTNASPILRQKASSPRISSPSMRQARGVPGVASKSYDFGYGSTRRPTSGPRSPVVTRPLTAPAHSVTFPKDIQNSPPVPTSINSRSATSESPIPELGLPVETSLFDQRYNPWSTYVPAGSYVSNIPVSPAQLSRKRSVSAARRASKTDASLYKQSILDKSHVNSLAKKIETPPSAFAGANRVSYATSSSSSGPPPTVDLPPTPTLITDEAKSSRGTAARPPPQGAPSNGGLAPADHRTSFLSLASSVSAYSPMLSPSMPAPPRTDNRKKSVDQQSEKQAAPHLYIETLGAMSLRNPFASADSDSRRPSGSSGERLPSLSGKRKAEVVGSNAGAGVAIIRRRSSTNETGGEESRGMAVTSETAWIPVSRPPVKSDIGTDAGLSPQSAVASPMPTGPIDPMDELLGSPIPTFRNPFFAKSSSFSQPSSARASQSNSPGRRPSFLADPFEHHGRSSVSRRRPSAGDNSPRRPSIASAASSSFGYPSKPHKLESRRLTDFAGRGIRVSLDAEFP